MKIKKLNNSKSCLFMSLDKNLLYKLHHLVDFAHNATTNNCIKITMSFKNFQGQ